MQTTLLDGMTDKEMRLASMKILWLDLKVGSQGDMIF